MPVYKSLQVWLTKNEYDFPTYISGVGWYAIPKNSVMPVPICPPGYLLHEAIRENAPASKD